MPVKTKTLIKEYCMELEDEIYDKIVEFSELGDEMCEDGNWDEAIKLYEQGLELVPEPKMDWEAATWLYAALGDTYFFKDQYEGALDYLNHALMCPEALGNAFIHLRIGQCFFELGNIRKAESYLMQAYMLEGLEIFDDEDYKYKQVVLKIVEGDK